MLEEDVNRVLVLVTDLQARDWRDEGVAAGLPRPAAPGADRPASWTWAGPRAGTSTVSDVRPGTRRDPFAGRAWRQGLEVEVENQGTERVAGAQARGLPDANPTPVKTQVLPVARRRRRRDRPAGERAARSLDLPASRLRGPGPPRAPGGGRAAGRRPGRGRPRARQPPPPRRAGAGAHPGPRPHPRRAAPPAWPRRPTCGGCTSAGTWTPSGSRRVGARAALRVPLATERRGPGRPAGARAGAGAPTSSSSPTWPPAGGRSRRSGRSCAPAARSSASSGDEVGGPRGAQRPLPRRPRHTAPPLRRRRPRRSGTPRRGTPFRLALDAAVDHPLARPFTGEEARTWIGLVPPRIWGRMPFREEAATGAPSADGGAPAGTPRVAARGGSCSGSRTGGRRWSRAASGWAAPSGWGPASTRAGSSARSRSSCPVFLDEAATWLTRPDEGRRNVEVGRLAGGHLAPRDAAKVRFVAPGGSETAAHPVRGPGGGRPPDVRPWTAWAPPARGGCSTSARTPAARWGPARTASR